MLSFWEKESYIKADYIIVGGGITGLSTAIELKERQPASRVVVLERGLFPSGASTRNAGFACFGSLTELITDRRTMGPEKAHLLVEERWQGLQKLRNRLGDARLGYYQYGGYELIRAQDVACLQQIEQVNEWLKPLFNREVFRERANLVKAFGFRTDKVKALIENPLEGQVHTGQMMQALTALAASLGVEIFSGARVVGVEEEERGVRVQVLDPVKAEEIAFSCQKLALCTNAFTRQFLPELELQPGRGQVLLTEPLDVLPFKGVFHMDEGFYYFRNIGNRIMLGGGRNLDFETENTTQLALNNYIQQALEALLREVIVPGTEVGIAQRWSGIMAFGPVKQPLLQKVSGRVSIGVRLGGMGIAIGSKLGERLAESLLED